MTLYRWQIQDQNKQFVFGLLKKDTQVAATSLDKTLKSLQVVLSYID